MPDLTPDLAELRRLAESATPGPWEAFGAVDGRRGERWLGVTTDMRATESARAGDVFAAQNCTRQDALFIAAANPAAVLALLDDADERDRLAEAVERVRALHIAHDCTSHAGIATICAHRPGICLACLKPLPCPTIRALDTTPETGCES